VDFVDCRVSVGRRQEGKLSGEAVRAPKQSNSEIIAAYLDAVRRKDASIIDRFFAQDVEYMVNGTPAPDLAGVLPPISADCHAALPWLGLHRGREAVKEFLAHTHRNLEVTAFDPREVGWFRLHALTTGRTVDISYSIRVELQDGLIVRYHFLENTFEVAAAFHSGGEWLLETDGAKHRVPS
jgi:ketosteroid isomerase-like protein